jgi:hypothetical protein
VIPASPATPLGDSVQAVRSGPSSHPAAQPPVALPNLPTSGIRHADGRSCFERARLQKPALSAVEGGRKQHETIWALQAAEKLDLERKKCQSTTLQAAEKLSSGSILCQGMTLVVPRASENKQWALAPEGRFPAIERQNRGIRK